MTQVRLILSLFTFYSGMPCPRSNRPSTMPWPKRRDKYICNYIQAGQPGTTMPNTKRNVEKGTKLGQTTKVSFVCGLLILGGSCARHFFYVLWFVSIVVFVSCLALSPWTISCHWCVYFCVLRCRFILVCWIFRILRLCRLLWRFSRLCWFRFFC